jgi:hypothetical protein
LNNRPRAWPFETTPEGGRAPRKIREPRDFVAASPSRVDAVVMRIGLNDAQLLLVDSDGAWDRWVYHSIEEAAGAAQELGLTPRTGDEFPEDIRVRMNVHRRTKEEFDAGAYPEQGRVGPVIPYPENRPRRVDASPPDQAEDQPS